ncbi:Miro domain containing protein [Nitzschia inconspicua]|uniref:Miro domain containing protein n=1 Tax=Nitzschia inconspicua TaxID=303405 RepID=A0A9K3KUM1_9STRA|nr:Miro domain containing protein [Nitzschia inconspicua]
MTIPPNQMQRIKDQVNELRNDITSCLNRLAILESILDENNDEHNVTPTLPICDEHHHADGQPPPPPHNTEQQLMKKSQVRNVLTIPTLPYDRNKPQFKIDEEDFQHIQEILQLRISHGTSIERALNELTTIDTSSGAYRVTSLYIKDEPSRRTYNQPHLPLSLCNMDALREINVQGTQIETLFDEYSDTANVITNLDRITLSHMPRLQRLPSNLGSFTKLETLQLVELHIDALPDSLSSLGESLETVMITCCDNLTELPNGFEKLHSLKRLDTWMTPIQQLPEKFGDLTNLQYLEMEFEHLSQLPEGFQNLTELRTLRTGEVAFHFPVPHLPNLESLQTSLSNFRHFDHSPTTTHLSLIHKCEDIEDTSVLDSAFRYLSKWSHIKILFIALSCDATYSLHEGFFSSFQQLQELGVICKLGSLEIYIDDITRLEKLKSLNLEKCNLISSQSLANAPPLLNLKKVNLLKISVGLELLQLIKAPHLEKLCMRHCSALNDAMFANLCTKWISTFESLHTMDVRDCSIENIQPEHFQHLGKTNLRSIDLRGNPIMEDFEDELEITLLPLVQYCHSLCDFGDTSMPASVAYHLCLNSLRHFVLRGQTICAKGLWALIFENVLRGMSLVSLRNRQMSQVEAIYVLLKQRGAEELFGSLDVEAKDGKDVEVLDGL